MKLTASLSGGVCTAQALSGGTKTEKTYDIGSLYDLSYATSTPIGQLRLSDGFHNFNLYPHITSTPRLQAGASGVCEIFAGTDIQTYTQAEVVPAQNAGTVRFSYCTFNFSDNGGVKLSSAESASKALSSTNMSWNLALTNTTTATANKIWLYIKGPVENVKYNGISGTGEGGRWILINNIAPSK